MNIIAVDDEKLLLHSLNMAICEAFPDETPSCFRGASEALEFAKTNPVDVAFLDIEMGEGMNGLELARELNTIHPATNIIFVTGFSNYYEEAFDQYASGYVKKPVLAKRILREMSHLRYPIEDKPQIKMVQELGPYTFDHLTGRVYRDGQDTLLKPKEFSLFCMFANNPGVFFTPEVLYQKVWGDEPVGNIDTVKMHVSRLRAKLDMTQESLAEIKSQRGKGYYLDWTP